MTDEQRLLLRATAPRPVTPESIDLRSIDAGQLLALAARHKVVHHVFAHIDHHLAAADRASWEEWQRMNRRMRMRATARHLETLALAQLLAAHDIAVCPLKGTLLSQRLYGDPTARHSTDVDLMVRPADVGAAVELLQQRGYELVAPKFLPPTGQTQILNRFANAHVILYKPFGGIRLELHWRLTKDRRFPHDGTDRMWDQLQRTQIGDCTAFAMRDDDLLIYLALHGVKHGWSRLGWLADFARFLTQHADTAEQARERSTGARLSAVWAAACLMVERWYHVQAMPKAVPRAHLRRAMYLADNAMLLRDSGSAELPWLAGLWYSHDSPTDSVRATIRFCLTPRYYRITSPADFSTSIQQRARAKRVLLAVVGHKPS